MTGGGKGGAWSVGRRRRGGVAGLVIEVGKFDLMVP